MQSFHHHFDYGEENQLSTMEIFQRYRELVESFFMRELKSRFGSYFDLSELSAQLSHDPSTSPLQDQGEVVELILSLDNFLVFKDLMLDYKTFQSGKYDNLTVQVNSIGK